MIVLVRAVISERRAKASAESANEQRHRTVAAAERSAKAVEDVAAAIRDSTVAGTALSQSYEGPTWEIEHQSGSVYALVNNTPFTQTAVSVKGPSVRRGGGPYNEIKAFSEIEFFGLSAWGRDQTINVEWTDESGNRQAWSKPLPPKSSVAAVQRAAAKGPARGHGKTITYVPNEVKTPHPKPLGTSGVLRRSAEPWHNSRPWMSLTFCRHPARYSSRTHHVQPLRAKHSS